MQLGVRLSFSWDTFGIEKIIRTMVRSGFLSYSIYIEFPSIKFKALYWRIFYLKKKINSEDTLMTLEGNMYVLKGFTILFFY